MRLVYLSTSAVPSRTANSIHVMKMCSAFASHGHEVILFTRNNKKIKEEGISDVFEYYGLNHRFKIIETPVKKIKGWRFLERIWLILKLISLKPDYIHGRSSLGIYISSLFGYKSVLEAHIYFDRDNFLTKSNFKKMFNRSSFLGLVSTSHILKEEYVKKNMINGDKVFVAPNGADVVKQTSSVEPSSRLKVGYIGHLYAGKGMEIVSEICKRCDWADFIVVGGTEKDIEYWKQELKGSENIDFLGFVPPSEVDAIRAGFDVLLAPYQLKVKVEGGKSQDGKWMTPIKMFEYMASGKAMLVSDLPVAKEIIKDGETGFLVDPDKIDDWVERLHRLNDNRDLVTEMGDLARKDFEENYTWDIRAKRILNRFCQS
jgi:glycosyltransferase involved in cell wall biosynthesis